MCLRWVTWQPGSPAAHFPFVNCSSAFISYYAICLDGIDQAASLHVQCLQMAVVVDE